jgi:hypothetical protein
MKKKNKLLTLVTMSVLSTTLIAGCSTNKTDSHNGYSQYQKISNLGSVTLDKDGALLDINKDKAQGLKIDLYIDPECPVCAILETQSQEFLNEYIKEGKINVTYHPIAIFDKKSTDEYSYRGSAYILGAYEYSTKEVADKFLHNIMNLDFRPKPGTNGLLEKTSDDKFKEAFIKAGGKEEDWNQIIKSKDDLKKRVEADTREFSNNKNITKKSPLGEGRVFTPFILINGQDKALLFEGTSETIGQQFKKAIDDALSKK